MVKYPPNLEPAGFLRRSLKPAYKRGFQRGVPFGRRKRKEGFGEEGKPVLSGCPSSPKTVGGLRGYLPLKNIFRRKLC